MTPSAPPPWCRTVDWPGPGPPLPDPPWALGTGADPPWRTPASVDSSKHLTTSCPGASLHHLPSQQGTSSSSSPGSYKVHNNSPLPLLAPSPTFRPGHLRPLRTAHRLPPAAADLDGVLRQTSCSAASTPASPHRIRIVHGIFTGPFVRHPDTRPRPRPSLGFPRAIACLETPHNHDSRRPLAR